MISQQLIIPIRISDTIATGDGKATWVAPYAGEFLDIQGHIETLGTGAGTSTDVQIRNQTQTKDVLSTVGAFEVNSATNLLEGQVINDSNAAFASGDVIDLDVDARASGNDAADLVIYATAVLFVTGV